MAHNRLRDIRANHVLWNRGMLSAPEPRGLQRCADVPWASVFLFAARVGMFRGLALHVRFP